MKEIIDIREWLLPIDGRDINCNIDHVTAQLVRSHVNRRCVRRDIDLAGNIEQERFFNI